MKRILIRRGSLVLPIGLALALISCSVQGTLTLESSSGPVNPAAVAGLELSGVTIQAEHLTLEMDGVHRGVLDGLLAGTARGLGALVLFPFVGAGAATPAGPFGWIGGAMVGAGAAALYFPFSLVNGMATAVPAEPCDLARENIQKAVIEAPWGRYFQEYFSRTLQQARPGVGAIATDSTLAPPEARSAVVEVSLLRAGTVGSWLGSLGFWTIDGPVALFVEGEARLFRQEDHHLLGKIAFRYCAVADRKKILDWGAEEGARAREYYQLVADVTASVILDEWFPRVSAASAARPASGSDVSDPSPSGPASSPSPNPRARKGGKT